MSAPELTEKAVAAMDRRHVPFDRIELRRNPDMVGRTGNLAAAIRAVEAVDAGLGAYRGRCFAPAGVRCW